MRHILFAVAAVLGVFAAAPANAATHNIVGSSQPPTFLSPTSGYGSISFDAVDLHYQDTITLYLFLDNLSVLPAGMTYEGHGGFNVAPAYASALGDFQIDYQTDTALTDQGLLLVRAITQPIGPAGGAGLNDPDDIIRVDSFSYTFGPIASPPPLGSSARGFGGAGLAAPVPEPRTWALLGLGIGITGLVLRAGLRRRGRLAAASRA